jgi:hypothetical protein
MSTIDFAMKMASLALYQRDPLHKNPGRRPPADAPGVEFRRRPKSTDVSYGRGRDASRKGADYDIYLDGQLVGHLLQEPVRYMAKGSPVAVVRPDGRLIRRLIGLKKTQAWVRSHLKLLVLTKRKNPGGARHPRNKTGIASLDKLAADPRIIEVWSERDSGDGLWALLAPGYRFDGEVRTLHEPTARELVAALRFVQWMGDEEKRLDEESERA